MAHSGDGAASGFKTLGVTRLSVLVGQSDLPDDDCTLVSVSCLPRQRRMHGCFELISQGCHDLRMDGWMDGRVIRERVEAGTHPYRPIAGTDLEDRGVSL